MSAEPAPALDAALRALGPHDLSSAEIDRRLERSGFQDSAREEALAWLRERGYVDDERFARRRAAVLARRGIGDAGIRDDLERRGIDSNAIGAALAAVEPEAVRAKRVADGFGNGRRAWGVLARKGFGEASIEAALARVVAHDPESP
jgi:SOS response regulatory protein OraA/RecX